VAVVFGGRSGEHEVSLMSAQSIISAIDKERYEVIPVGIAKDGRWLVGGDPPKTRMQGRVPDGAVPPRSLAARRGLPARARAPGAPAEDGAAAGLPSADICFRVLHRPYVEDGPSQGLFGLAGGPYVGAGVAASAVAIDKAFIKMAFRHAGLPVLDYSVFTDAQ